MQDILSKLKNPNQIVVLGEASFLKECLFGTNPKHFTEWMQRAMWESNDTTRREVLYRSHATFHANGAISQPDADWLQQNCNRDLFLKTMCKFLLTTGVSKSRAQSL